MEYIVLVAVLSVMYFIVRRYLNRRSHLASLKKLPGTPPTYLIGNMSWVLRLYSKKLAYHPGIYITERILGTAVLYRAYGLFTFWMGTAPVVSVSRADTVEKILNSSISLEKSFEYTFLHRWLGTGLLTSDGSKWKFRRKLLTPAFHFRILEDFLPVFNDQSLVLIKKLRSLTHQDYVDITPLITLCTLDIVCETVMGYRIGAQSGSNSDYVQAVHNLGNFFNQRSIRPWLWSDRLFGLTSDGRSFAKDIKTLHNFTEKVIREKKKELFSKTTSEDSSNPRKDNFMSRKRKAFLDLLLDLHNSGQNLSEADIREEVDTFMFEGHDTTAMSIIFALYCIGLYPEIQKKIAEEIEDIFEQDYDRPITFDDIRNMKYLERCLKESQRIYPSVPIVGRMLNEEIFHEGMTIPRGITVHCNILGLHRDPQVFHEPEIFDPERFNPNNTLNRHPFAYVPFSAGPRNCIGQKFAMLEEKTVICNVLRHFLVVSLDPRDVFHLKVEFTLRPAQQVRLKFIPRRC